MSLTDITTEALDALTTIIPVADMALYVAAGVVFAIAARFGGRLVRSFR